MTQLEQLEPGQLGAIDEALGDARALLPPGLDEEFIRGAIPDAAKITNELIEKLQIQPDLGTAISDRFGPDFRNDFDAAERHPGRALTDGTLCTRNTPLNNREELKGHWKRLVDEIPEGAEVVQVRDKLIIMYDVGISDPTNEIHPNRMHMVFDLGPKSTKKDGIHIEAAFQSRPEDGACVNWHEMIDGDVDVFIKKYSLFMKIVRPLGFKRVEGRALPGINGAPGRIEFFRLTGQHTYSEMLYHENEHTNDFARMDNLTAPVSFGLTTLIDRISLPAGLLTSVLTGSFWWTFGAIATNLATYILSRSRGNPIGAGFHGLMVGEINSYLTQAAMIKLVESNGFASSRGYIPTDRFRESLHLPDMPSKEALWFGYEPIVWAVIDIVRDKLANNDQNRERQTIPATAQPLLMAA